MIISRLSIISFVDIKFFEHRTGFILVPYSNDDAVRTKISEDGINYMMRTMGFNDRKEYLDSYPGRFRYNSYLTPNSYVGQVVPPEDFASVPEGEWGLMQWCGIFYSYIHDESLWTGLSTCEVIIKNSLKEAGNDGLMPLMVLPTISELKTYVTKKEIEECKDNLWVCPDWGGLH